MADLDNLVAAMSGKTRVVLDPDDPLFLVVRLFQEAQKEALAQLTKVVTDAADKNMAATQAAEAAARAKAEAVVTQAGEWTARKIREAGDLVVVRIQSEAQTAHQGAGTAARRAMKAAYLAGFAALAALAIVTAATLALIR
jgi:hypothetical protein